MDPSVPTQPNLQQSINQAPLDKQKLKKKDLIILVILGVFFSVGVSVWFYVPISKYLTNVGIAVYYWAFLIEVLIFALVLYFFIKIGKQVLDLIQTAQYIQNRTPIEQSNIPSGNKWKLKKRHLYLLLFGIPGFLVSIIVTFSYSLLIFLLFAFIFFGNTTRINEGEGWSRLIYMALYFYFLPIFFIPVLIILIKLITKAYTVGKIHENDQTLNKKHIFVSLAITVASVSILLYPYLRTGFAPKEPWKICSDYCTQNGYSSNWTSFETVPTDCNCYNIDGKEGLKIPIIKDNQGKAVLLEAQKQIVSIPVQLNRTVDPTEDWLNFSNTQYGISFKYPSKYSTTTSDSDVEIALWDNSDKNRKPRLSSSPDILFKRIPTIPGEDYKSVLIDDVIFAGSGLHPKSFSEFSSKKIGDNNIYFIQTGLFEGVLSINYYLVNSGNQVFVFTLTSSPVDWTNPNFNFENDSLNQNLQQILSTFKFTN